MLARIITELKLLKTRVGTTAVCTAVGDDVSCHKNCQRIKLSRCSLCLCGAWIWEVRGFGIHICGFGRTNPLMWIWKSKSTAVDLEYAVDLALCLVMPSKHM